MVTLEVRFNFGIAHRYSSNYLKKYVIYFVNTNPGGVLSYQTVLKKTIIYHFLKFSHIGMSKFTTKRFYEIIY
jgi:hypothetical protein